MTTIAIALTTPYYMTVVRSYVHRWLLRLYVPLSALSTYFNHELGAFHLGSWEVNPNLISDLLCLEA